MFGSRVGKGGFLMALLQKRCGAQLETAMKLLLSRDWHSVSSSLPPLSGIKPTSSASVLPCLAKDQARTILSLVWAGRWQLRWLSSCVCIWNLLPTNRELWGLPAGCFPCLVGCHGCPGPPSGIRVCERAARTQPRESFCFKLKDSVLYIYNEISLWAPKASPIKNW